MEPGKFARAQKLYEFVLETGNSKLEACEASEARAEHVATRAKQQALVARAR